MYIPSPTQPLIYIYIYIYKYKYMICNIIANIPCTFAGKPCLMKPHEVSTLLHEFGHGLQHMLTTIPHGSASGFTT